MKKNLIFLTILSLFIIAFSCNGGNSTMEVDCGKCYVNEPDSFELEVNLSIASAGDSVYLEFFKGNVESGELSWEGNVGTPFFYHLVPVNEFYSVRATYKNDSKTIYAIDGSRMISRYIADACDTDCWIIKGELLDVRLKY
jgi:hypothetical protein